MSSHSASRLSSLSDILLLYSPPTFSPHILLPARCLSCQSPCSLPRWSPPLRSPPAAGYCSWRLTLVFVYADGGRCVGLWAAVQAAFRAVLPCLICCRDLLSTVATAGISAVNECKFWRWGRITCYFFTTGVVVFTSRVIRLTSAKAPRPRAASDPHRVARRLRLCACASTFISRPHTRQALEAFFPHLCNVFRKKTSDTAPWPLPHAMWADTRYLGHKR